MYGAGGAIGSGVAKTFAREGARVFLTGRNQDNLDRVAKDIADAGGTAEVAVVDALDERAVDEHAGVVAAQAGDLTRAITTGITTNFITARAAAHHMIGQGSGVILALNSGSAHGSPMMGINVTGMFPS